VPRIANTAQDTVRFGGVALLTRPAVWLLHCLLGRPRDSALAILVASAVSAIVINSLFLQRGPHPAPIFAQNPQPVTTERQRDREVRRVNGEQPIVQTQRPLMPDELTGALAPVLPRQRPPEAPPKPQQGAARTVPAHKDSIAEILAPAQQLTAIQRDLSNFGYGQITPNGVLGPDTRAAIERFERDRHLPVTGQVSERLVRELAAMTGRPL
jgi:hypothetical protein